MNVGVVAGAGRFIAAFAITFEPLAAHVMLGRLPIVESAALYAACAEPVAWVRFRPLPDSSPHALTVVLFSVTSRSDWKPASTVRPRPCAKVVKFVTA